MPLAPRSRLGPYEVLALIGAGGMGEVYRARDTRLNRDVAIKVLPAAFSDDPDRLQRFEQEARAAAALNHPNILAVHDIGTHDGAPFIVSELLEGETLRERLNGGALPARKAVEYAAQIAHGLAAAHEKGIVHRDLKPENLFVTTDGRVKILDFGLAKLTQTEPALGGLSTLPTTPPHTVPGVVLGTIGYMAPEQVRGLAADHRADIFAFGAILYEMLAGHRAFQGATAVDTMTAILKEDPADLPAADRHISPALARIVDRCLEKNPSARFQTASDLAFALESPASESRVTAAVAPNSRRRMPGLVAVALGSMIGAAVTFVGLGPRSGSSVARPSPPVRFAITLPASQNFGDGIPDRPIAFSADGSRIVWARSASNTGQSLFVRSLNELEGHPIPGAGGSVRSPAVSPDGNWVAYVAENKLFKLPVGGGTPIPLCDASTPRGTSWGADTIYFATNDAATGLLACPAAGGQAKVLTTPDRAQGEFDHLHPTVLPDGRGVLFVVWAGGASEKSQVAVLDFKTGRYHVLVQGGTQVEYLSPGYLVYAAGGGLRAVRFDLERLAVVGDPVPVLDGVMQSGTGAAVFATSRNGTLVYAPSGAGTAIGRSLVWVDRQGHETPMDAPLRAYTTARLSPDGTHVASEIRDADQAAWLWDMGRRTLTRLTFDSVVDQNPIWTPDGRAVVFASAREGPTNLYRQRIDGSGRPERLTTSDHVQSPLSVAPDGTVLVLKETLTNSTGPDLVRVGLNPVGATVPLISGRAAEDGGEISPDGHWIAYSSNESGRYEIYVRPFPHVQGSRRQISSGGTRPAWARNGREVFYQDLAGAMTAAEVQVSGSTLTVSTPRKLFDNRYFYGASVRNYDVAADGRFLMIKDLRRPTKRPCPASSWSNTGSKSSRRECLRSEGTP